jgi:hypothetical protein
MPVKDGWYMFRDSTVFPDHVPTTIQTDADGTRIALGGGVTTMWNDAKGYGIYIGKMRYIRLDGKRRKS